MPKRHVEQPHSVLMWGTQALRQRPNHAYLIGLIAAEWSHLEREIAYSFAMLMGTQQISSAGQFSSTGNELAAIALNQIYGTNPRISLIKTALAGKVTGEAATVLQHWLGRVKKVGERRNEVVHGRWALDSGLPDEILLAGKNGPMTYSASDLEDILNEISATAYGLSMFAEEWLQAKEAEMRSPNQASEGPNI